MQIKILQGLVALVTTNTELHGEPLAQALCLCFRLHTVKSLQATASAIIRQMLTMIFDRVIQEQNTPKSSADQFKKGLQPCGTDAYFLLQDLCNMTVAHLLSRLW